MSDTPESKEKDLPFKGGRKVGARSLTVAQKAEAVALWKAGTVTLDDLAKKFKKRPETFSRLFKRMGVEKGSAEKEAMRRAEAAAAARVASDVEETLKRIAQVKDTHFQMSRNLAAFAMRDIVQARAAGVDVGTLKDVMAVYKMAADVVGNSRKELFEILNVAKHEATIDDDDLPDLTVRELSQSEVDALRDAPTGEDELGGDGFDEEALGGSMMGDEGGSE